MSANILSRIIQQQYFVVENSKALISLTELKSQAKSYKKKLENFSFSNALREKIKVQKPTVIAEFKRKSPSEGILNKANTLEFVIQGYDKSCATATSILTNEEFFAGSINDLKQARELTDKPLLRKDFIIDEYQIYESLLLGADAILLIAAVLDAEQMMNFYQLATSLGLDVLVEVHAEEELNKIADIPLSFVGINNRNLKNMQIDLNTSINLSKKFEVKELEEEVENNKFIITESGIKHPEDVKKMLANNIYGFLVGSSLMKTSNPHLEVDRLFKDYF